jgi:translation initiation factor IF-2
VLSSILRPGTTIKVVLLFKCTYMKEKPIGEITHWFNNIHVAVIELKGTLKKGDKIAIRRGEEEFEETIASMQVDHNDVASAKKGDDVAIKLSQKAKEGALVFRAE